jgi:hypothetical protein
VKASACRVDRCRQQHTIARLRVRPPQRLVIGDSEQKEDIGRAWLVIDGGSVFRLRPGPLGDCGETVADSPIDRLSLIRAGDSAATAKTAERVGVEHIRGRAGRRC